jgi:(4-alkanoyl-5-oxo-2,5-dihydrofuran-3-yl)methyl phosphate reductase
MIYLITGATGDVGSRVVEHLLKSGERPRVFVRNEEKARSRFSECVDYFVGDMSEPETLKTALQGVSALFLINSGPEIPARDAMAASIAKAADVKRLVKLSSMDVEHGLALGVWHEQGEAAIRASGVPFTFVRPTGFMSNLLAWSHAIKSEGIVRSSAGDGKRAFIHSDDIAAVSAKILMAQEFAREYKGTAIPITGPDSLSVAEATAKIGAAIGKQLTFHSISDEEARRRYAATGAPNADIEAHVALWRAIREGKLGSVTNNVEEILGRKPIGLDQWAKENAEAFR